MYMEKGAVFLGEHHPIIFGNILVTRSFKSKAGALILAAERC